LNVDVEGIIEKGMQSDQTSTQLLAMFGALDEFGENCLNAGNFDDLRRVA
jgi:hypothetical protein